MHGLHRFVLCSAPQRKKRRCQRGAVGECIHRRSYPSGGAMPASRVHPPYDMRLGALVLTVGSHGLAWNCNTEEALEIRYAGMSRRYLIHSREVHCSGPGPFPLIFNLAPHQLTAEQQNFVTGDFSFGINGRNHGNQLGAKGNRFSDIMDIDFADQNFILITLEGATVKGRGGLSASKRTPAARDEVDLVRKILDRTRKSYNVGDVFAVGFREGATLAWHLACHMQLRAIAPVHGAPLPGPAFASCPFQPPPAVVFTGDHDPNDVATRRSLAYYEAQMRQNYPDQDFISKITFCNHTVTCETSSTRCGEGRVMLCYAKSPTSAHNCALESSHRNSSGRHNPCCLDSSSCDVAYAEACSACASYDIWAGANCAVATSDPNKSCLGTSAPDVHTTISVLEFFADYVRLDQQSSSTMPPSSEQLWNSKEVLQKLRSGFASWGLLVSAWMGQRTLESSISRCPILMLPEFAASILPVSTLTIMAAPVLRQRVSATLQEARRNLLQP
eukprot:symbB.v1.2.001789.t1/scaffold95.1/size600632/37